ncbi:MAG: antitoxin family protein [Phycisphaeraceae bacterium]
MNAIHAIFEKGVFRPTEPVDLPDRSHVVFEPRLIHAEAAPTTGQSRIYEILSHSYETDQADIAQRHDEHQP